MDSRLLLTLKDEFHETIGHESLARDLQFPEAEKMIKVAMGMRRTGKTYFLFQKAREIMAAGVPLDRILYINFEDERLLPMDNKAMGKLIDGWYSLYPENYSHCCYLFLDEVQNIADWQAVVRRVHDTKNVQIYLSGSSAKLLSKEIATSLRGRSLATEVFPYSYAEYLRAQEIAIPPNILGNRKLDTHRKHLQNYFKIGGFPAVQKMIPQEHLDTLQNYVELVIFRDIVERHNVSNISLLKYLTYSLLKNISALFSIHKFFNDTKSQGHQLSKETLHIYFEYLQDAFLIFSVPVFTESLRQKQTTSKKIYAIDNGLVQANTFNFSENIGKLFENQVFLDLRRQKKEVFYYKTSDGYEVDFVTRDIFGKYEMIQVVWDSDDPQTLEREERALRQAEQELGFSGTLMDLSQWLLNWESKATLS